MRLTLRTLLAYLDDILEPADAREIGTKIAESPVAGKMVDRIREVMRRRRITAPELTGPGSGPDPNLVAEYLDNTLSPEAVTEIERICLESDIHLAETAGCHQILTIVLGEPVDISAHTRERMYALGAIAPVQPQDGGTLEREPVPSAMAGTRRTAAAAAATVQAGDETFAGGVPEYLRRRPLWKKLVPAVAVAALAGWAVLVWQEPSFRGRPTAPAETAVKSPPGDAAGVATPAEPTAEVPAETVAEATPSETAVAVTDPAVPAGVANASAIPAQPAPEAVVESPAAEVVVEPTPAVEAAPLEQPPPAVVDRAPPMKNSSLEGVALRYQPDANDWNVLQRQTAVNAGDWIATPEPFTSRIDVNGTQLAISVNSGSIVQLLSPPEGRLLTVLVDCGRVGLYRPAGDGAAAEPVKVNVQVAGLDLDVELLEPGTLLGIEAVLRPPTGKPAIPTPPAYDGGIYVVAGSANVQTNPDQRVVLSKENGWLPWPMNAGEWQPGPLLAAPQWLTPEGRLLPSVDQTYANIYERMFTLTEPVSVTVPGIVRDRRPRISRYAVDTLALTQNIPQLMNALQSENDEARRAAIVGLRDWLPRSGDNAAILHDEATRYFRDEEVAPVEEMLWGYSPQDFRSPDVSARLVGWLGNENLAIRELALFHIRTGANRQTDYHPLAPVTQRQSAINRLNDIVRRHGALVPPEVQPQPDE
jgi:hypothetical protein